MNNRPVEQALGILVPTHANDLPQELLSLALSLVAQSRSFSTSLKPEEEIARPYACAEIACRRLSRALKLPPLLGHPPCPPRVYKKLYSYLDRSLASSSAGIKRSTSGSVSGTPSRAGSAQTTPTKASRLGNTPSKATSTPRGLQNTPSKSTPLKRSVSVANHLASPSKSARKSTPGRPKGLSSSTIIPDAPAWVMTAIRTICKTLSTPAPRTTTWSRPPISRTLPPHIFAGVSSILYLTSSMSNDEEGLDEETLDFLEPIVSIRNIDNDYDFKELVYAMVVAVYFLVLARRRNPAPSEEGEETNNDAQKMDKKTFTEMRQTALTCLGLPTDRKHRDDVDQWIALIMEQGWANGQEWFQNIPLAGELDGEDEEGNSYRNLDEEDAAFRGIKLPKRHSATNPGTNPGHAPRGGLLPGLGTMMQDRVDWLSEDRREDFIEWKSDIMARIQGSQSRTERAAA
ncbi:Origin recognition complex subunit 6 [Penicillium hispanicum]|uniref:Origin recognition complex subunit 6 n=1 Tax=Penicillium hispanicum TaxID=1080232 RepID=UPI00253FFADC|nr:Origin recognition complex subunit 6 [Penicillium hispanicum]KAJ5584906.1 Origin recognition complex subunit 6 [Penicillium hispanicum]